MNAEKSILVEKTPTTSRRKVTKTNAQAEGSRIPHTRSQSAGKHVTITTNVLDVPKQRNQDISSSQWDIPSPDYLDESPTLQRPQKEASPMVLIFDSKTIHFWPKNFSILLKNKKH